MTVITDEQANHVLFYFGAGGYEPGSFTALLLKTIAHADRQNRAQLALGFPGYVAAMDLAQNHEQGLAQLSEIAAGQRNGQLEPRDEIVMLRATRPDGVVLYQLIASTRDDEWMQARPGDWVPEEVRAEPEVIYQRRRTAGSEWVTIGQAN